MIPQGKYAGRITRAGWTTAQNGTDYVEFDAAIEGNADWEGTCVPGKLFFTDKSAERSVRALRACGCTFPLDDITDLRGVDSNRVELDVQHEEWQGKTRARVAWINEIGLNRKPGASEVRARFKGMLAATRQANEQRSSTPTVDDSDVPF